MAISNYWRKRSFNCAVERATRMALEPAMNTASFGAKRKTLRGKGANNRMILRGFQYCYKSTCASKSARKIHSFGNGSTEGKVALHLPQKFVDAIVDIPQEPQNLVP